MAASRENIERALERYFAAEARCKFEEPSHTLETLRRMTEADIRALHEEVFCAANNLPVLRIDKRNLTVKRRRLG